MKIIKGSLFFLDMFCTEMRCTSSLWKRLIDMSSSPSTIAVKFKIDAYENTKQHNDKNSGCDSQIIMTYY